MRCGPLVTAHSGCEDTPENTLESMLAGIAAGADTVEVDVRATRDGTPVLMHDAAVLRDGAEVPVEELSLDDLNRIVAEACAARGPAPVVTTLDDALALLAAHPVMANLDLKDDRCIQGVVRLVRRRRAAAMIVITGCTTGRVDLVRAAAPELPVLLNVELPEEAAADAYLRAVHDACRTATEHHCCGINVPFRQCRSELVEHARRRYLPVSVWTVDSSRDMKRLAAMGVHSITTYRPRALAGLVGRKAAGAS